MPGRAIFNPDEGILKVKVSIVQTGVSEFDSLQETTQELKGHSETVSKSLLLFYDGMLGASEL